MSPGDIGSSPITSPLDGRRILVSGASSGIGEAIARACAEAGAGAALMARSVEPLEALAAELDGVAVPADVTDVPAVRAAVQRAAGELGGLDAVINGAGVVRPSPVADADPADWQLMFDVNVVGLLNVTQAAIPHLREAGHGDVVNISSMSGRRRSSVPLTVYAGTKFAVHTISAGLREELRDDGIRVTILSPGFVVTDIFDDVDDDELRARYTEAMTEQGLEVEAVAAQVVHALAQPPGVELVEVAMLSMSQG